MAKIKTLEEFKMKYEKKLYFNNWHDITDGEGKITNLYWSYNNLLFSITAPHEGNEYKYMLRINPANTFDKWGNADIEEFYDDMDSLNYDIEHNDWIYRQLMWIYVDRYIENRED